MASTEFVDPYLDPETGLLRNKVGAQTKVALDEAEGDLSFARLVQLMDHPVKPTGDLDELRADHELRGMSREQFIDRLAYHYDQFNYVHPFREGNGRTQRVFWNRVARDAGWQLDWREVHGATNDQASRAASEQQDFGPLREMFDQIVSKATPQGERDAAWRVAERARLSFPTSATEAVRRPQSVPSSAPQARTTMHVPGQSHRGPGNDGPGASR
ncbi:Fic family protein [Cutibacterium acnes]